MKKVISTGIAGIFLLSVANTASGQLTNTGVQLSGGFTYANKPDSKKSSSAKKHRVSPTIMRNFLHSYGNAHDEKWYESRGGFIAVFNLDGMDCQVAYNKKGNWVRTIRYYHENKLAQAVRHIVKSTYYDYDINSVQEIEKPLDPIIYLIQLLGKTELINLSVCNGEMVVLQKFKKSE
jgi:hypothetical protein